MIVFCSETCRDNYVLPCKECGKETKLGDTRHHTVSWVGLPGIPGGVDTRELWCSDECNEKHEERERRKERRGEMLFWGLTWGLPALAILGVIFGFWFYYPNFFMPLVRIVPLYALIAILPGFFIGRNSNGTSGPLAVWLMWFGLPFGGISLLALVVLLIASIWVGFPVLLR